MLNSVNNTNNLREGYKKQINNVKTEKKEKIEKKDDKNVKKNDKNDIEKMINQANLQTANFERLISSLFDKQINKIELVKLPYDNNLKSFFKNLIVDKETIAEAKEAISEDGYYGVKKTSERIFSLAKAVAGNDPKKLDEMREAVEKGFDNVKKMWGDELPDISKETYDTVMEKFDNLQKQIALA